jgi:hypothetical protein
MDAEEVLDELLERGVHGSDFFTLSPHATMAVLVGFLALQLLLTGVLTARRAGHEQ